MERCGYCNRLSKKTNVYYFFLGKLGRTTSGSEGAYYITTTNYNLYPRPANDTICNKCIILSRLKRIGFYLLCALVICILSLLIKWFLPVALIVLFLIFLATLVSGNFYDLKTLFLIISNDEFGDLLAIKAQRKELEKLGFDSFFTREGIKELEGFEDYEIEEIDVVKREVYQGEAVSEEEVAALKKEYEEQKKREDDDFLKY